MNNRDSIGARIKFWCEKNIKFYSVLREKRHNLRYGKYFEKKREAIHNVCSNKNIIVLSNDCLGGLVQTDLGIPICTPLINVSMNAEYFIKLCNNIDYYFKIEPKAFIDEYEKYPVLQIEDIMVFCPHYKTVEEAIQKWKRGCRRYEKAIKTDYEICVIMSERFGFTDICFEMFEKIPFKYKILFTKKNNRINDGFYIKGKNGRSDLDWITEYVSMFDVRRYYDQFDFTSWFLDIYNS